METGKALAVLWVTRGEGLCPATADGNGEENLHRGESNLSTQSLRTWRERVEREVGAGIGMGKTCKKKKKET